MPIFIICTRDAGGRYVHGATTREIGAKVLTSRAVEDFTADGWDVTEVQNLAAAQQFDAPAAGVPDVINVWHLHRGEEWLNIELYRVKE